MRSALFVLLLLTTATMARDDGRYANSPLKPWSCGQRFRMTR